MNSIIDRCMLLVFSITTLFLYMEPIDAIAPILTIITLTCLNEYIDKSKISFIIFIGYGITCFIFPNISFFYPVLSYDLFETKYQKYLFLLMGPFLFYFDRQSVQSIAILLCITSIAFWLRRKTVNNRKLQQDYISQRDDLTEMSLVLESKVSELLQKQDDDVTVATLNERNRIAREIHDNVGHLLSSSILQLGALMTITKDEMMRESLGTLKDTLSTGMNSIRSSVHNLQDNAVDLHQQLNTLINDFSFCDAELVYNISDTIPIKMRYAVVAIVKEALSNIMKHSNATQVAIVLHEHPKLYQLIITDNGTKQKSPDTSCGIGLENMKQRVSGFNGIINISQEKGFRIFISFPKGDKV